jgi:anti-sigma factor RsiW
MSQFLATARFRRDHAWTPDHMSAFLDGELRHRQRRRLERHAAACGECRRVLGGLRAMLAAMNRLPAPAGGHGAVALAAAVRLRLDEPPAP